MGLPSAKKLVTMLILKWFEQRSVDFTCLWQMNTVALLVNWQYSCLFGKMQGADLFFVKMPGNHEIQFGKMLGG